MTEKASIIIPCYKSAKTLEETLQSVFEMNFENWEALIINDGSPDNVEEIAFEWIKKDERFLYYKKENGGLGTARNYGIKKSNGRYILPLDSDNKVGKDYVRHAIKQFQKDPSIGVVYGDAQTFGTVEKKWVVGEFNPNKLLVKNYIDACAVIKKEVYDDIGLYDVNMPHQGNEDWDFWIRVANSKFRFHYLNEIVFEYRVLENSMIRSFSKKMHDENRNYIYLKHGEIYGKAHDKLYQFVIQSGFQSSIFKPNKLIEPKKGNIQKHLSSSLILSKNVSWYNLIRAVYYKFLRKLRFLE